MSKREPIKTTKEAIISYWAKHQGECGLSVDWAEAGESVGDAGVSVHWIDATLYRIH